MKFPYESFDQFINYHFMQVEPESAGNKDTYEDNFDNWLAFQNNESITAIAKKYVAHFVPQYDVLQDELAAGIAQKFQKETWGEVIA